MKPRASLIPSVLVALGLLGPDLVRAQEEPPLPAGLEMESEQAEKSAPENEPALPMGLEDDAPEAPEGSGDGMPALPAGLDDGESTETPDVEEEGQSSLRLDVAGFWEARVGPRVVRDTLQEDFVLGEGRLQIDAQLEAGPATFQLVTDFYADAITEERDVDIDKGDGAFDLREASVLVRPFGMVDLKVGRQILTWGVGDMLFINDLFPKDFVSFFSGRDVEYLKAPSDAIRLAVFTEWLNVDLIFTARFDPDRFLDGDRLSFFDPGSGQMVGGGPAAAVAQPDRWIQDGELHARVYRNVGAWELAAYAYRGFWKSPAGLSPTGALAFPELSVYGGSARGPLAGGLLSLEGGYYDSRQDRSGANPGLPNGQGRVLAGFERELWWECTMGLQYYAEVTQSPGRTDRHLLTLRLTQRLLNQDLIVGVFLFVSPDDHDGYVRPRVEYKVSDGWRLEAGGNLFFGPKQSTLFGQLHTNSSVYAAVRSSF